MTRNFDQVTVSDVSRHFGRRRALSNLSFRCEPGSILGLLGPNGAGKSTLLAILATLLRPTSGAVQYGSLGTVHDTKSTGVHGLALRAQIGFLTHDLGLYTELTARENLEFFAGIYGMGNVAAVAERALSHADLLKRADDPVASFSRGMRQRIALERVLIHGPQLLLLDEPFTGLDDQSVATLITRLLDLRTKDTITVLATHDLEMVEGLFDQAVLIRDGRMIETIVRPKSLRSLYQSTIKRESQ